MTVAVELFEKDIEAEAKAFAQAIAKKAILSFARTVSDGVVGIVTTQPAPAKRGRPRKNFGPCKVLNCGKKILAKGLCSSHYQKARLKARAKAAKGHSLGNGVVPAATA